MTSGRARRTVGRYGVTGVLLAVLLMAPLAGAGGETGAGDEHALLMPLAPRSLLLDVAAGDGWMVAVGERGHILVSRDDGRTWIQKPAPTRATLTAVAVHGTDLAWVVGHDEIILGTRDGGETWHRLHAAPEEERPLLDVHFRDERHGIAIGAYGLFLRTDDGGATWTATELDAGDDAGVEEDEFYGGPIDVHLNQVSQGRAGRLVVAAEAGTIYRSDDDGETWAGLSSPYEGSFFGSLQLDGEIALLFGLRGHVFRTEDGGTSWDPIESPTPAMLTDGIRLRDGRVVISGLSGTVLVSADGGSTFELRQREDRDGISSLIEASDGALIVGGEGGVDRLERF